MRHKKDSSWGSLRPASVSCDDTSSDNNEKGKRRREYPQPSFTLRPPHHGADWPMLGRDPPKACRIFCVSPEAGVFFAKKDPPGVNSMVGGDV